MQITKEINVDFADKYPPTNILLSHELNVASLFLKVNLYNNKEPLEIDDSDSIKAAIVTDGVLISDEHSCLKTGSNQLTTNISSAINGEKIFIPGKMLIEIRIISDNKTTLVLPVVFLVKVTSSIVNNAKVTDKSYGTVAEILKEVATARGNYKSLNERLNADEESLNRKLNHITITDSVTLEDCDKYTSPDTLYRLYIDNVYQLLFNTTDNGAQYRFTRSGNIYFRSYDYGSKTWSEWINITRNYEQELESKEDKSNKVTEISGQAGTANDRLYPSVSAVWNFVRDYMFTSEDNFGNGVITLRTLSNDITNVIDKLLYTKADIETGEIHDNNEAWYADDNTKVMTGTYTLIGDLCVLKATCHRIADWGVVYYSLPVAATAGAATIAVGTKIYSVSTDTQENISVLKIQNINGDLMTNGTVSFTLVYPYKNF